AVVLFLIVAVGEALLIQIVQTALVGAINEALIEAGLPHIYLSDYIVNVFYVLSLFVMILLYFLFFMDRLPTLVSFRRRRLARWRKKLSALLAVHYALGPAEMALLMEDNQRFSLLLQRFLGEHQVPYALPFYDENG